MIDGFTSSAVLGYPSLPAMFQVDQECLKERVLFLYLMQPN
jgi:hypothetical protein